MILCFPSGEVEAYAAATVVMARPAVVVGRKAVEEAMSNGFYPVVDQELDVFAIPSVEGKCAMTMPFFSIATAYWS